MQGMPLAICVEADARRWPGCRDMCQEEANSSVTAALVIAAVVG